MARSTDAMLAKYVGEIEDRQQFIDSLVESANGEDLTDEKMDLITRAKERIEFCNRQMQPLEEARRISGESAERIAQIAEYMRDKPPGPEKVEYRSAGEYVLDVWKAGLGLGESTRRIELFNRAAAHQTTADNPGLLPEQIVGPVINWVDESRPLTTALGPRDLPSGSWSRPRVTQHTNVDQQSLGEKTELVSRKMIIEKLPVTADTWGGYLNVSRQDIDWSSPQIMDIVIADLAGYYAQVTEAALCDAVFAAATAGGTGLGTTPTPEEVAAAVWAAVGAIYTSTKGAGRLLIAAPPDMLGLIGPLFAPVNPQNAQSPGFSAGQFSTGVQGTVAGIPVVVTAGLDAGAMLVLSTAAVEVYEDRIGSLQVVEPSVLGVQVAYAGYFAPLVLEGDAIIKLTSA